MATVWMMGDKGEAIHVATFGMHESTPEEGPWKSLHLFGEYKWREDRLVLMVGDKPDRMDMVDIESLIAGGWSLISIIPDHNGVPIGWQTVIVTLAKKEDAF